VPTWTRRAQKDFQDVPDAMKQKVRSVIDRLDSEPSMGSKLKGKLDGLRSVHVGRSYRVLYSISEVGPLVRAIRPRKDAYR
jgi:addiction module RelE/StbE family toxin